MTARQETGLQLAAIILLTAAGYYQVADHHFVWDTIPFVLENPWIHEWSADNMVSIFTDAHRANWQPIVLLSHAADISLFGYDSGAHHLTNLVLHVINASLLFWVIFQVLVLSDLPVRQCRWTAFLTALIFSLHPQHVESVAWVVERKDVLYACFALACLGTYLRGQQRHSWRGHVLPFLFFCLSIGAKPMAVTLPFVLLMLDAFPLRRATDLRSVMRCVLDKSPYLLVSMIVALVTLLTQSQAMPGFDSLPQWARTLNAIDNSLFYIEHYLWPVNLSPFYPYPENAVYLRSPAFWLPGSAFLVVSTIMSLVLWYRGHAWPGLLFAFYLVTLLPVSGLIHVGPAKATDHYVYLATIPLSLLTALAICRAWIRFAAGHLVIATVVSAYLFFLVAITHQQVSYWNNPLSLWSRVLQLYPASPFGHRNLASGYAEIGEWDLALQHAELSLQLGSPDTAYVEQLRARVRQESRSNE